MIDDYILFWIFGAMALLMFAAMIGIDGKRAKATPEKAGGYENAERLCMGLFCVFFALFILNIEHITIVDMLKNILQRLEVLTHGR